MFVRQSLDKKSNQTKHDQMSKKTHAHNFSISQPQDNVFYLQITNDTETCTFLLNFQLSK